MDYGWLKGKTILVTGGTGSIGSEIVKQLLETDAGNIIIFSRDEIKHFLLKQTIRDERLHFVVGDVRDFQSIERIFTMYHVDIIFNASAMKHVLVCEESPIESVKTNIIGAQNLVDLAIKYDVSEMITISTDKAANPVNVMGATKFITERITLNGNKFSKNNQIFSVVRFGNVANSRGSVIPVYLQNLKDKKSLMISDPNVTRFILSISDAVNLVLKSSQIAQGGEIFILKMKAFRLGDLVEVMINKIAPKLGIKEKIETISIGLAPSEKINEELINEVEIKNLYEIDELYVILSDKKKCNNYLPSNLVDYTSDGVDLLKADELEKIVLELVH